jgi:hypothetical protein
VLFYAPQSDLDACKGKVPALPAWAQAQMAEANALLERRGNEYMQAEISDVFKSNMSKLTQAERAINASDMSPQEKREQLDEIRRMKIGLANAVREISDKTIRLVGGS